MSDEISVAKLSSVPYTLLIPLVARARGTEFFPDFPLRDLTAQEVLKRLGKSGDEFMHKASVKAIQSRTQIFVDLATAFFRKNPASTGVNLGCGLSNYFQWLDNGQNHFIDADLPEVIDIRTHVMSPRNSRHRFGEISLTSQTWWDDMQLPKGEPAFLMIEGVLMYLSRREVNEILRVFGERATPGSELVFDFMSWLGVGRAQAHSPIMKHTKAEFRWGARRISDLTAPHLRLKLLSQHRPLANQSLLRSGAEIIFQRLTSVPFYGIARLGVE